MCDVEDSNLDRTVVVARTEEGAEIELECVGAILIVWHFDFKQESVFRIEEEAWRAHACIDRGSSSSLRDRWDWASGAS